MQVQGYAYSLSQENLYHHTITVVTKVHLQDLQIQVVVIIHRLLLIRSMKMIRIRSQSEISLCEIEFENHLFRSLSRSIGVIPDLPIKLAVKVYLFCSVFELVESNLLSNDNFDNL